MNCELKNSPMFIIHDQDTFKSNNPQFQKVCIFYLGALTERARSKPIT